MKHTRTARLGLPEKLLLVSAACFLLVSAILATVVGYAYFSKKDIYEGYFGGRVELLFDKLSDEALATYQTETLGIAADAAAVWGTEENPYVISDVKHLYNLAELQRLGYFYKNYISGNYTTPGDVTTYNDGDSMPYFLVCDPETGKPTVIDGSQFRTIRTIGTEEYPFIGSVKGAFVAGETEVGGKKVDTSVFANIKVVSNPADADAGLFGRIHYLGDPEDTTTDADTGITTFNGVVSVVSDLLLYDVSVEVKSDGWDAVTAFVEDHVFSFSTLSEAEQASAPHENHHIGILAGHVTYTQLEFISVYYSDDSMVAIDLSDNTDVGGVKANYMSASGIVGYMENMNPTVNNNGVGAGSGQNNSDVSYGTSGGGGQLSGTKSGYIIASSIYAAYGVNSTGGTDFTLPEGQIVGTRYLRDLYKNVEDENGNVSQVPLCTKLEGNNNKYYFYDGVFTFAMSEKGDDILAPTWWEWEYETDENGDFKLDENGDKIPLRAVASKVADSFSIGSDSAADWDVNTTEGNKAVVAYLKAVDSDGDLKAAIDSNKQLFIMNEKDNKQFLMSLYEQSQKDEDAASVEQSYYTNGTSLEFAARDSDIVDLVLDFYADKKILPTDITPEYNSIDTLTAAIRNEDLKVLNVGITTNSQLQSVERLKELYKISSAATGEYSYFTRDDAGNESPVEVDWDNYVVPDYNIYPAASSTTATDGYQGYFYYTVETRQSTETLTSWITGNTQTASVDVQFYNYFWQPLVATEDNPDLAPIHITETKSPPLESQDLTYRLVYTTSYPQFFGAATGTTPWQNENFYAYTVNGVACEGIIVNATDGQFETSEATAFMNGTELKKKADTTVYFFYQEFDDDSTVYYGFDDMDAGTLSPSLNEDGTPEKTISGLPIYTNEAGNYKGVILIRYPTYELRGHSTEMYLHMMTVSYTERVLFWNANRGTYHSIWTGPKTYTAADAFAYDSWTPTVQNDTTGATVKFNTDGSAYILYTYNDVHRYVQRYDHPDPNIGTIYNGTANTSPGTKLYIYTVEGTQDIVYGRVTYDPDPTTGNGRTEFADQYVLMANSSQSAADNYGYYNDTYTIKKIEDLRWHNDYGQILSSVDLKQKFGIKQGINWGLSLDLFGWIQWDTEGIVTAPVGSNGTKANIPQGCVAFRVNKVDPANTIRVIVAVPVSEYFYGEMSETLADGAYIPGAYRSYFNLWQLDDAGSSIIQTFDPHDTVDRFYLPGSHPYEPGVQPVDRTIDPETGLPVMSTDKTQYGYHNEYILVNEEDADGNVTSTNRCYLNGERVLIAYEFAAPDIGIYVLGAMGYNPETGQDVRTPMEIVYVSAGGVASDGRDGEGGSQLGTIDFVYDNGSTIFTVKESSQLFPSETETDDQGNPLQVEDPTRAYYPSYCFLYFDNNVQSGNAYVPVNQATVKLRRWVNTAVTQGVKSTITYTIDPDATYSQKLALLVAYGRISDVLDDTKAAAG